MQWMALLLTLISGCFFGIGYLFVKQIKGQKELSIVSIGCAFTIMLGMIFFDLLPEMIEISNNIEQNKWLKILLIILFVGLGMGILKIFDHFLPDHHHDHKEKENKEEHNHHMYHVGFILAFSLILHNILEGMSIYLIATESLVSGLFTAIGVGLHNLPLGMEIASSFEQIKEKGKEKMLIKILLILSSAIGALLIFIIPNGIPEMGEFFLLSLACGMILYIALFELLKEAYVYRQKKSLQFGVGIGLIFVVIMLFLA